MSIDSNTILPSLSSMKTVVIGLGPFEMGGEPGALENWSVKPSLLSTISSDSMESGMVFLSSPSIKVTISPLLKV